MKFIIRMSLNKFASYTYEVFINQWWVYFITTCQQIKFPALCRAPIKPKKARRRHTLSGTNEIRVSTFSLPPINNSLWVCSTNYKVLCWINRGGRLILCNIIITSTFVKLATNWRCHHVEKKLFFNVTLTTYTLGNILCLRNCKEWSEKSPTESSLLRRFLESCHQFSFLLYESTL